MTLLFYNRNQGKGEFYNIIDAQGNIGLLKSYSSWRKSWTHIVYSFSPSLLFYDRSGGAAEFYDLDGQGNMHLVSSTTYSTGWTHILLVGVVRVSGHAVLLFYNAQSGDAKFYRTDGQGGIHLLSSTTFSKGWTHIITNGYEPGAFTQENNYLVLFYNATSGVAQFYHVDIQGKMHQFSNDMWSTGWTHIVPHFAPSMNLFNLLFYNANSGDAKTYHITENWSISNTGSTTWAKGWTKILLGDMPLPGEPPGRTGLALLFYNGSSGTAQFYLTGPGGGVDISQVSNTIWSKDWSEILWF